MTKIVEINKVEAASRQIDTAIDLFFNEGDPVSIQTLAGAAYRVITDLCKHRKTPKYEEMESLPKPASDKEFWTVIYRSANFFKHADRDPNMKLKFKETGNEYMIYFSIIFLSDLQKINKKQEIFWIWMTLSKLDLIPMEYRRMGSLENASEEFATFPREKRLQIGRNTLRNLDNHHLV